jgi:hypothetical protein
MCTAMDLAKAGWLLPEKIFKVDGLLLTARLDLTRIVSERAIGARGLPRPLKKSSNWNCLERGCDLQPRRELFSRG